MKDIFKLTYEFLMFISRITGFSYKEINIIVWFIIIPMTWMFLIDKTRGKHYSKISFTALVIIGLLLIKDFSKFCNSLFDVSADYLRGFNPVGMNYTEASVVICLLVPVVVYFVLIKKAYFRKKPT